MAQVVLRNLNKTYEGGYEAVKDLNLEIEKGEFLVLVGPSGCGKSTTLRMIAGLEDISGGDLEIDGQVVNDVASKDRDIAMVFQNYALYPHMTVAENIGFTLRLAGVAKAERKARVAKVAELLQLTPFLNNRPTKLSGGQRQRVAMGRAIVREPAMFLMDEPLSNLDAKLRSQMRAEIKSLQKDIGVTMFYVTHDQVEAMTMGDRVAVIKDGVLQQVADPKSLYEHPVNVFVAAFIGSPAMNLYEGVVRQDPGLTIDLGEQRLDLTGLPSARQQKVADYHERSILIGIRPEDIEDAMISQQYETRPTLRARVELVEALGSELLVHFSIGATGVDAGDPDAVGGLLDTSVARFDPRSSVDAPGIVDIAIAIDRIHFFDPVTRLAI